MLRAFLRAPSGIASLVVIVMLTLVAAVAPLLIGGFADQLNLSGQYQQPNWNHLLGTDALGRDVLARVLVATRISIVLSLGAVAIGAAIGLMVGLTAPLLGPRARSLVLRAIDSLIAFPLLLVALFISTIFGSGAVSAMIGIGIGTSFGFARVSSALALTIGGRDFILAARTLGISNRRRMLRYVLPNVAETLLISTTVAISSSIAALSTLSFLGLGVQAPLYDWGGLLTEGVKSIFLAPAAAIGPALAIMTAALAFGFAGEALARATNPLLWSTRLSHAKRPPSSEDKRPDTDGTDRLNPTIVGSSAIDSADAVLRARDLTVSFVGGGQAVSAVAKVSFALRQGERLGIVGESGSGKTMLAMAIGDLLPSTATMTGAIEITGQDITALSASDRNRVLAKSLSVVFQDPMSSLNPALRLSTQLMESPIHNRGLSDDEARKLAIQRLKEVNLPTPERQLERYPHELSGGMRQRVMIAMALMNDAPIIIADEPTTALDVTIQAQIMDLLREITAKHNTSIIFISHNLALVSQFCDRLLVMYAGHVVEELTAKQLVERPLHPYTNGLLGAVPDLSRDRAARFTYIAGTQPDIMARLAGCPYHPRCALATDRCIAAMPPLLPRGADRRVACWEVPEQVL